MDKSLVNLVIKLQADNERLRKDLAKAQKHVSGFASEVKKLGPMVAAAFSVGAVVNFAKTSLQAYDEMVANETLLRTALKGREDVTQNLIRQAADLQKITLFEDDETVRAQSLIAAFVKEEEQIKKIIPLVQDFATAKRMDLASAADLVAKTLGSTTNALKRYGIQVEGEVGSTQRLESAVKGLSDAFGGQAEAAAKVGLGPLKQLQNTWDDLKEVAGEFLAEGLLPIVGGLKEVVEATNNWLAQPVSKKMQQEQESANQLALQLMDVTLSKEEQYAITEKLRKIAPEIVKGINSESIAYDLLRINLEGYNAEMRNKIALQQQGEQVEKALSKETKAAGRVASEEISLRKHINEVTDLILEKDKKHGAAVQKLAWDETKSWTERAKAIQEYVKANDLQGPALEKWIPTLTDTRAALGEMDAAIYRVEQAQKDLSSATNVVTSSQKEQEATYRQFRGVADDVTTDQAKMIDSYRQLVDSTRDYKTALSEAEIQSLSTARSSISVTIELTEAQKDLIDEYAKGTGKVAVYDEATLKLAETWKNSRGKASEQKKTLEDLRIEYENEVAIFPKLQKGIEYLTAAKNSLTAADKGQIATLNDQILRLQKQIELYNNLTNAINKLNAITSVEVKTPDMGAVPDMNIQTNFSSGDIAEPLKGIEKIKQAWDELEPQDKLNEIFTGLNAVGDLMGEISQIQSNKLQQELNEYEYVTEQKKEALQKQLDAGLISQEEYNTKMAKLEADLNKEKNKIAAQNAKNEQKMAIFRIIINTASAIAANLATPWMIPLIVSLGAFQLGVVKSTPIPKFAKGGKVEKSTLATVGDTPLKSEIGFYKKDISEVFKSSKTIRSNDEVKTLNEVFNTSKVDIFDSQITKIIGQKATPQNPYYIAPVKVPHLATGGLVTRKTFAVVGDNIGSASDPEVVAPLSDLTKIISEQIELKLNDFKLEMQPLLIPQQQNLIEKIDIPALENIDRFQVEVIGKITGDDIHLANKRAEIRQSRIR